MMWFIISALDSEEMICFLLLVHCSRVRSSLRIALSFYMLNMGVCVCVYVCKSSNLSIFVCIRRHYISSQSRWKFFIEWILFSFVVFYFRCFVPYTGCVLTCVSSVILLLLLSLFFFLCFFTNISKQCETVMALLTHLCHNYITPYVRIHTIYK